MEKKTSCAQDILIAGVGIAKGENEIDKERKVLAGSECSINKRWKL